MGLYETQRMTSLHLKHHLKFDRTTNYFLWSGDTILLKELISNLVDDESVASADINEDKHHKMLSFKAADCTVKHYTTTRKIVLQGPGSARLVELLTRFSESSPTDDDTLEISDVPVEDASECEGFISLISCDEPTKQCECTEIKLDLHSLKEDIEKMKSDILSISSGAKIQIHPADGTDTNSLCKLREDNTRLSQEVTTMSETIRVLEDTVKRLEEEKSTLIKTLGIVQQQPKPKHDTNPTQPAVMKRPQQTQQSQLNDHPTPPVKTKEKKNNNKKTNSNSTTVESSTPETDALQRSPHHANRNKEVGKIVCIVGDSIIKGLKWWKLSNGETKVQSRCFRGATVEDMEAYVLPTMRSDPDEIIVHVGTNDLQNKSGRQVAESVVDLAENISQNSKSKVTISSIIHRSDKPELSNKVNEANKLLKTFTTSRNWGYIDNSRIGNNLLNKSGLHLNERGSTALAKNISQHLHVNN